jgi:hypothetical protein
LHSCRKFFTVRKFRIIYLEHLVGKRLVASAGLPAETWLAGYDVEYLKA